MKSNKGVTLISLVVYVMSFLVIVGIVALISNFFFSNSKVLSSGATGSLEFDMLNAYLIKETQQEDNKVINLRREEIKIINEDKTEHTRIEREIEFSNGNQYIFIKENENVEYGKIIFSSYNKYFILCDYIEEVKLPQLDKNEIIYPLEELEIVVKILGKEYTQNYIIEK